MLDDIIDRSETRRGKICWYKRPEVGMMAINDSIIILECIPYILKKYFSSKPYYLVSIGTIAGSRDLGYDDDSFQPKPMSSVSCLLLQFFKLPQSQQDSASRTLVAV